MTDDTGTPKPVSEQSGPRPIAKDDFKSSRPATLSPFGQGASIGTIMMHPESQAIPIDLPSRGKLYPSGIPSKVMLREMGMRDMMILQTPALWKDNQVFQMIFQNCVQGLPPNMSILDLFTLDREALLVALRILSFGRRYKVKVTCPKPSCQHKYEHILDLETDFGVKYLDTELEYPMVIQPVWLRCGRKVVMRLMTFRDEIEVDRKADAAMDTGTTIINTRLMDQLEATVTNVSDMDLTLLKPWLEGLSAHDASILDQTLSERYFGIDNEFSPKACPKCGNVFTATMPINEDFFRANLPKTETPQAISKS